MAAAAGLGQVGTKESRARWWWYYPPYLSDPRKHQLRGSASFQRPYGPSERGDGEVGCWEPVHVQGMAHES